MKSIYLDWAATAPVNSNIPALTAELLSALPGNPSSLHNEGLKARKVIEQNRDLCSDLLKVRAEQLVFTSGGSESNSIVLSSLFRRKFKGRIIISQIEHPSVYEFAQGLNDSGFELLYVKAESGGFIKPETLGSLLTPETQLVSIIAVNNETGAVQNLKDIVKTIRDYEKKNGRKIHVHTDAVQILGKLPFYPGQIDIDSASFSAHKIGGSRGTGLLYLKKPIVVLSPGGGQEFGIRPGTENTAGIAAFSNALEAGFKSLDSNLSHAEILKSLLVKNFANIRGIKILFNSKENSNYSYSPYIISATTAPVPGEVVVRIMKDEGFEISTGSACSSKNRNKQMRVLMASGISQKEAAGSIRISTGSATKESDILDFCSVLESKLSKLRKYLI